MIDQSNLIQAIAAVAARWLDPSYPQRQSVVEDTLVLENRFTEEALAFAINQQMALLTEPALHNWLNNRKLADPLTVGVLNAGNIPFVGLQDWLAVVLTGASYRGVLSSKSPVLLPAFAAEVVEAYGDLDVDFVDFEELFDDIDALVATGNNDTIAVLQQHCKTHDVAEGQCLFRGHKYAVAVLTGKESAADREYLAEDVLLHEGQGCRSVAIIWAPEGLSPDAYLEKFAVFRSVFPVHPRTPGSLKMKQAFLDAVGVSHAYGEGLEFLVSKGEPEQQEPGHVRWVDYRTTEEVISWIGQHKHEIQLVLAENRFAEQLALTLPVAAFGEAQRPALDWCADDIDTIAFLMSQQGA
ncbi:MAG: hypothetical protein AAF485_32625 [Chloroflexota bacterium]